MTIKDSFAKGPKATRQRRLTATQRASLRESAGAKVLPTSGSLPNNRTHTEFSVVGSRKALGVTGGLLIKVAYPLTIGSPHPRDVVAFITSKFPGMVIEDATDRKAGLIEIILKRASHCDKCGAIHKDGCGCDGKKKAQMAPPQGASAEPGKCQRCGGSQLRPIKAMEDTVCMGCGWLQGQMRTCGMDEFVGMTEGDSDILPEQAKVAANKWAQMDAGNVPAGTAATPVDGQRDALSSEEVEGTGKIGQAEAINGGMPCMHCGGRNLTVLEGHPWCNDCQAGASHGDLKNTVDDANIESVMMEAQDTPRIDGRPKAGPPAIQEPAPALRRNTAQKEFPPQAKSVTPPPMGDDIAPTMDAPINDPEADPLEEEMSLQEAVEILQEATETIVQKITEGDTVIDGQEVEPVAEPPAQAAPPAATPIASGAPIQAAKTAQSDPPGKSKEPSWLVMQKLLEAKDKARKRVEDQKGMGVGGQPNKMPTVQHTTSEPGAINKEKPGKPGEQREYQYGTPEDQEFFWLDELAETRVTTSIVKPELGGMRNDLSRPYGITSQDGKQSFQGIPIVHAGVDPKTKKDNTLVSVLPINIYQKIRNMTPPLREHGKWQWQKLTPQERKQAMYDMMFINKAIRDRIRNIMTQAPDGAVKQKVKVEDAKPSVPRTMNEAPGTTPGKGGIGLKPVPPQVRKKSVIDEIMAVDPAAKAYWEQLLGEYGHQMVRGCCPEHDGVLDQRETDMREIAAELGVQVDDETVGRICASLRRPHAIGFFEEFARRGFSAPPMDKMVDMALELSQSDAGLARELDRLTLKYLMKTSDLMNAMTPDAQRTVLLRAIRGDKRIYNSLRRLYERSVGVEGPADPAAAPRAVAAALRITAAGFEIKPHGQSDDAVKGIKDMDKAKDKKNKQVIPGHVRFQCEDPRYQGKYVFIDVTWDPADCKGRDEDSIRQLLISYVKGLESFKQFIDFGFMGTPHLKDVDTEAGFAVIFFHTSKPGDAVNVTEQK